MFTAVLMVMEGAPTLSFLQEYSFQWGIQVSTDLEIKDSGNFCASTAYRMWSWTVESSG